MKRFARVGLLIDFHHVEVVENREMIINNVDQNNDFSNSEVRDQFSSRRMTRYDTMSHQCEISLTSFKWSLVQAIFDVRFRGFRV